MCIVAKSCQLTTIGVFETNSDARSTLKPKNKKIENLDCILLQGFYVDEWEVHLYAIIPSLQESLWYFCCHCCKGLLNLDEL